MNDKNTILNNCEREPVHEGVGAVAGDMIAYMEADGMAFSCEGELACYGNLVTE